MSGTSLREERTQLKKKRIERGLKSGDEGINPSRDSRSTRRNGCFFNRGDKPFGCGNEVEVW